MDNIKRNLHYVVFAVGILVGLILLGAGYFLRSGQEAALDDAIQKLNGRKNVPTAGDLTAARNARTRFDQSIEKAIEQLKGPGSSLLDSTGEASEPNAWATTVGVPAARDLRARWAAMESGSTLPEKIRDWKLVVQGSQKANFWEELSRTMTQATADDVPTLRAQIRIIAEACIVCEELRKDPRYAGTPVKFVSLDVEQPQFSDTGELSSPWREVVYTLNIECLPALGYAVMSELLHPTQLTARGNRRLFPNRLDAMQASLVPRPLNMRYRITNEMKAAEGIPEDIDPDSAEGQRIIQAKVKEFESGVRPVLPVSFAFKLHAQNYNPKWQIVNPPEQS